MIQLIMKAILLTLTICLLATVSGAQSFSGKTVDINLNFKDSATAKINTTLPIITWTFPQIEYSNSLENHVTLELMIHSDVELRSATMLITDGTTTARGNKQIKTGTDRDIPVKQPLSLPDGTNVIELMVENVNGGKTSSKRTIVVGKAGENMLAADRKDYALLFATDEYDNWTDLVNPIDDARSVAKLLSEKYGFEVEIVENPNDADVLNKLRDYAERKFKQQDQLLIFFAGHGYFDDTFGEGYVVAKNSLVNDKAKTTYISHSRLKTITGNLPSEHVLLVMDVCFGGTFDDEIAGKRGLAEDPTTSEFLARKLGIRTRKYLTSGGKEYVSDGIPGKHSPFTLKILQAFADGGGEDRILTLSEVKTYVEKLKPEPRLGGFGDDKTESDFVFINKN
jgi:hypothetical protein